MWPASTVKLTSRNACTPAKLLLTPRISSIAVIAVSPCLIFPERPAGADRRLPDELGSLELRALVIAAVNQNLLPIALVDHDRLEQIGRHHLDAILIGRGVVDRNLLVVECSVHHVRRHLGEVAGVLEDGGILLAAQHRLDRRHLGILAADERHWLAGPAIADALQRGNDADG